MPTPYNKDFTTIKSAQLQAIDCRPTGATKTIGAPGDHLIFTGVFTAAEAIEVGECIAMVRVPKNFQVTGGLLSYTANTGAVIGLGDPFCCGRLLGPILCSVDPAATTTSPSGTACAFLGIITKTGATADGCGLGYTYTCETDLVVTNGYGENSFGIGGGKTGTANGGPNSGVLASGTRIFVRVEGQIVPSPNA